MSSFTLKPEFVPYFLLDRPDLVKALTPSEMKLLPYGKCYSYYVDGTHALQLFHRTSNPAIIKTRLKAAGFEVDGCNTLSSGAWLLLTPEQLQNEICRDSIGLVAPRCAMYARNCKYYLSTHWTNLLEKTLQEIMGYNVKLGYPKSI